MIHAVPALIQRIERECVTEIREGNPTPIIRIISDERIISIACHDSGTRLGTEFIVKTQANEDDQGALRIEFEHPSGAVK